MATEKEKQEKAKEIVKLIHKAVRKSKLDPVTKKTTTVPSKVNGFDIANLLLWVEPIFTAEPMMIDVMPPVSVLGDTHGQIHDVVRCFEMGKWPPEMRYLFLGDYVDRGPQNTDTITMMFALKFLHPTEFFLIRGNHETKAVNSVYGFKEELQKRFPPTTGADGKPLDQGVQLWKYFNKVFSQMPLAALINKKILCMHGGLSPELKNLDQIRQLKRPIVKLPDQGLETDLLWADPHRDTTGFKASKRGVSYLFGVDAVVDKCEELGIELVARAHQVVDEGHEFFCPQLVTLFSAPDYCDQYHNHGGVMWIGPNTECKMRVIPSHSRAVTKLGDIDAKGKKKTPEAHK